MKIFIDSDFKCHTSGDKTMAEINTDVFDGKCDAYICGHRFVPEGETWLREDGTLFHGEMIAPWKPLAELERAQAEYEHEQLLVISAERDSLLEYIADEEFTTDTEGNRYRKEVGTDGEIHLVLIESYTGELFQ